MLRRTAPVLVALVSLTTTACDTGRTPDAAPTPSTTARGAASVEPSSDAVRTGVAALYAGDGPTPEEADESACFADALLERLTPDELAAAGIVGAGGVVVPVLPVLDVATALVWVEAQGTCVDFVEVSTRALGAQSKGKVVADAYADCLRETITGDEVDAALVNTLSGGFDTPEVRALADAQAGCARAASPPE